MALKRADPPKATRMCALPSKALEVSYRYQALLRDVKVRLIIYGTSRFVVAFVHAVCGSLRSNSLVEVLLTYPKVHVELTQGDP